MPDDNVIKFRRPEKKRPSQQLGKPSQQVGKPSLAVAVIVAAVTVAILVGITMLFGGYRH